MFKKVLIANRGEIAVRILKTLKTLHIPSVTLYVKKEKNSLHVKMADEACQLEGETHAQTYLNSAQILSIAKKTGVEAIHPGYGFLAESAPFAAACAKQGVAFIGPTADALEKVGNKLASRNLAKSVGVPVIPYLKIPDGTSLSKADARKLGFPLLIKAVGGGGGKGLKIVEKEADLPEAIESARREAQGAFGNSRIYGEKYLKSVRHIEVQILADAFGNILCLGERECSLQRRYQKIIEESPSPFVNEPLREKLFDAARKLALRSGYTNAGTVEFLVDGEQNFYFLEVNARLQVEHPVTEMRTGLDLVRLQLEVAAGEKLKLKQEDLEFQGHAIEARINAENPDEEFLPSSGKILACSFPTAKGLRLDTALVEEWEVSPLFDPLLAKMIAWDKTREGAREKIHHALAETVLLGVSSNIDFLKFIVESHEFQRAKTFTSTAEKLVSRYQKRETLTYPWLELAAVLAAEGKAKQKISTPWERLGRWRLYGS